VTEFLIAIGSNIGDRLEYIRQATREVETRCGMITARSRLYETAPIGAADQAFLNGAFIAQSGLDAQEMLRSLLDIERHLGRTREVRWGNRTIDLDIAMARDSAGAAIDVQLPGLQIPHPHMLDRDFVLVPAAEIGGNWIHPGTGRTLGEECATRFPCGL
jgi:2-amino-4-hydroxy-6-hydroxymethyldihydropteridine diphosphokinase